MKFNSFFLALLFSLIISFNSFAQKAPIKFGEVALEDLKMEVYENDSSASAVVLADFGTSFIDYRVDGFKVVYERHIRIKILNKDGYDWGNGEVRIYHNSGSKEEIRSLKGFTYNLEAGKIVKTKLEKTSIFEEEINDNWDAIKFSMPNVKEGAIVEYSYGVTSDFLFNYREWYFQKTIPVIWSEYRASFIEYYRYEKVFQGYIPIVVAESEKGRQTFSIISSAAVVGSTTIRTSNALNNYEATNEKFRWVAENVPAFRDEPFITSRENYISKVSFELESENWPNKPLIFHRGTWEKLNRQFLDYENFGAKINESAFLGKYIEDIIAEDDTTEEKIAKIHSFVKENVKWDGNSHKYLRSNFKKILENKKGSSAEINLLLTTMLKRSGLDADPVLISTRSNGFVKQHSAISDQFNYVLCKVVIGDKFLLIDATEEHLPINALPERCLNGIGYVISETKPGWIDIPSSFNKKTTISGDISLSEDGELSGMLNYMYDGYNGLSQRNDYFKKGEEEFISEKKNNSKWELESVELENQDDYDKPFIIKYHAKINEGAESMGNLIYLDPILSGKYSKNPFTLETREYPIDFSCPIEEIYYVTYNIPEGYGLETLIKPFAIALPDRGGMFTYKIIVNGGNLTVLSKVNINKTLYVTEEYPFLKEFFAQLVAKQNEQVVLKKM